MNKFLLDTSVIIWALSDDKQLNNVVKDILRSPKNKIYYSLISVWEMAIKSSTGKLKTPPNLKAILEQTGFDELDLNINHVLGISKLKKIHKDPFDRLLISQAKQEKLTLITSDKKIEKYKVKTLIV